MARNALPPGFAASPPIPTSSKKGRDWLVAYIFLAPAAAVFAGLIAYPFADGITKSFTDKAIARPGTFVGAANFLRLLSDPHFSTAALNSLVLTICVVAIKLVLGLASAVLLSQPIPMRGLMRAMVFLPWAVPGLIAGLRG